MTRDDVIDVLSAVAAGDRRTTSETDVDLWCAVIGDQDRDLAIRAVIDHRRECPGVWLEPGHIYQRCRAMVRDKLEREPDEIREARQEQLAAKVLEDVDAIAAAKTIPDDDKPLRFTRPSANPRTAPLLQVACPHCHAPIGQRCTNSATQKQLRAAAHPARITAAAGVRHEHHTTLTMCPACRTRPLITDQDTTQGVCNHCAPHITPPKTQAAERNRA